MNKTTTKHTSLAILLATYNGAKYLKEQLNSLLTQTYNDFTIYIHDDNSTDATLSIIQEYTANHNNIILLQDPQTIRGAKGSFGWLMEQVEAQYYMFCDQDDVWLPTKIQQSIELIKKKEIQNGTNTPIVINSDLQVVDQNLKTINESMWVTSKLNPTLLQQLKYLQVYNFSTGCTMIINKQSRDISLPIPPEALMHDSWITLKTLSSSGKVYSLPKPTILYRQHQNNEIGAAKINLQHIISRFFSLSDVYKLNKRQLNIVRLTSNISTIKYLYNKITYLLRR